VIPEAAVEAARVAIHRITLDDEFTHEEADMLARAALEAAAPHMQTASDRAMRDIKALMDDYFSDTSRIVEVDVVMRLARIVGAYDVDRIGEAK